MKSLEERALEDYFDGLLKERRSEDSMEVASQVEPVHMPEPRKSRSQCSAQNTGQRHSIGRAGDEIARPALSRGNPVSNPETRLKQSDDVSRLQRLLTPKLLPYNPDVATKPPLKKPVDEPLPSSESVQVVDGEGSTRSEPPVNHDQMSGMETAVTQSSATEELEATWCRNGRPSWAQAPFDVLMLKVSGLSLAVPLIALGQIHPLGDQLTPIFGRAEWFMGLMPVSSGQKISVINTSLYVMPERYREDNLLGFGYVVTFAGSNWGLAVDQVDQPTRLQPDDVTWRGERSKRPWLAGTVKTAMCALLDVPQFKRLLAQADAPEKGKTDK